VGEEVAGSPAIEPEAKVEGKTRAMGKAKVVD